jgi:hypothetical protein
VSAKAKAVAQKASPPSEKYDPTLTERAIRDKYFERTKQQPAPDETFKVTHGEGSVTIKVNHPDYKLGTVLAMDAIGTGSHSLIKGLVQLSGTSKSLEECELNFALSMVKGIKPRDDTEAMLATQMAALHNATMTAARRLAKVESMLSKCALTFAAQMEALKKYRSNGEQNIRVQHVTVHDGGQAIVSSTLQTGGGGYEKSDHQPHEPGTPAATGPALLGNREAHAPAMPCASGSGLDRVPVPRSARRGANRGSRHESVHYAR